MTDITYVVTIQRKIILNVPEIKKIIFLILGQSGNIFYWDPINTQSEDGS